MKIVVPVKDDKVTIFKRTGMTPFFAIFEDNKFIEIIDNSHEDEDEHDESESHDVHVEHHKKDVEHLKDCDVILLQTIGGHMKDALIYFDIEIVKTKEKLAQSAVDNFLNK